MRTTGNPLRAIARGIAIITTVGTALLGLAPPAALAVTATYYVAATGSDTNDCLAVGTACATIQAAIDRAEPGDTVSVGPGTFAGNLTISERITLEGAGSTADDSVSTILTPTNANLTGNAATGNVVVYITGTGGGATDRVTLRGLRVTGATGSSNQGTGIMVWEPFTGYLTIDDVVSTGNGGFGLGFNTTTTVVTDVDIADSSFSGNAQVGFKTGEQVKLDGLTISGSHFDQNGGQGIYWAQGQTSNGRMHDVTVSDSTFSSNGDAGLYMNKVDQATFDGITVAGNTARGMDFAYRYGTYGDVALTDSTFTGNGGYGIQVRPRGTTSPAASASNVAIIGNTVSGSPVGVLLVGALDLTTTEVRNNAISAGSYALAVVGTDALEGAPTGAPTVRDNALGVVGSSVAQALDLAENWWGQDSGPAAGQAVTAGGTLTTAPWIHEYVADPARTGDPGFWPTDAIYGFPVTTVPDGTDPAAVQVTDPSTGASISVDLPTTGAGGTLTIEALFSEMEAGGYSFSAGSVFFDVSFDGTLSGPATICLTYPGGGDWPTGTKLYHGVDGAWVDVTTSLSGGLLCGEVDGFSPFIAGILTIGAAPHVANVAVDPATQPYGGDVTVTADATDSDGTITSVEYTIDAGATWHAMASTGGAGYSGTIAEPGVVLSPYTVYVRATDDDGNVTDPIGADDDKATFSITVADSFIAFTGNAYNSTTTARLEATVSGPCKAGRSVDFEVDAGSGYTLVGSADTNTAGVATLAYTGLSAGTIADVRVSVDATDDCTAAEGTAVIIVAGTGDSSNGGGSYTNTGRMNFGYSLQVKLDRKTGTKTVSGQILWQKQGSVRIRGIVTGYTTGAYCPTGASGTCALVTGSASIYHWDGMEWIRDAANVAFRVQVADGGSSVTCLKKNGSCTTNLKPDWFQIWVPSNLGLDGTSSSVGFQIKGGNIWVK